MKTTYAAVAGLVLIVGVVGMQAAAQEGAGAQNRGGAVQKGREKGAAVIQSDAAAPRHPGGPSAQTKGDGMVAPQVEPGTAEAASGAASVAVATPPTTAKSISEKGVSRPH